jgi:hypothetical protein
MADLQLAGILGRYLGGDRMAWGAIWAGFLQLAGWIWPVNALIQPGSIDRAQLREAKARAGQIKGADQEHHAAGPGGTRACATPGGALYPLTQNSRCTPTPISDTFHFNFTKL